MRRTFLIALLGVLPVLAVGGAVTLPETAGAAEAVEPADAPATAFGSSVWPNPGERNLEAVARLDAAYGEQEVLRVYYGSTPPAWSSVWAAATGKDLAISFKGSPTTILSGSLDDFYSNWFATAPTDRDIWWTYFHEPEDNIAAGQFNAADFRAAWAHLADLADQAGNPRLRATLILMDWTVDDRSGRDWHDYYPGGDVIDVFGWDTYEYGLGTDWQTVDQHLAIRPILDVNAATGKPFGIGEFGATRTDGRPEFLREFAVWAANHGAEFVTYFDSDVNGDYRLMNDPASRAAWRSVVTGSLFDHSNVPTLTSGQVTSVTRTSATFHCDADTNGLTTEVYFTSWETEGAATGEGFDESAHRTLSAPGPVAITRTGLTPGTEYTYHCKAHNAATNPDVKSPNYIFFTTAP